MRRRQRHESTPARGPRRTRRILVAVVGPALLSAFPGTSSGQEQATAAVVGDWTGSLQVPGAQLTLVFHVERAESGFAATMDSPDQGAFGIPIAEVRVQEDSIHLDVRAIMGTFGGAVSGDSIVGEWTQGGQTFPLTLARSSPEGARPRRPQDPEGPRPYREEAVRFENAQAGLELAGTLTLPPGAADRPVPAALLISGSGPQDRDEALMGHRPFLVLADHLTRQGIAVLRVDDRGFGESTGDFASATTADFVGDAAAGVAFLRSRREVDAGAVGLVGHSEGGLIAPLLANRSDDVAWIVLLAGPGVPGDSLILLQSELVSRAMGAQDDDIHRLRAQQRALFEVVRSVSDTAEAERQLQAIIRREFEAMGPDERAQAGMSEPAAMDTVVARTARQVTSPWYRHFLGYDPRPALRALDVPTLALFGEKDLQVPPDQNAPAMRAALERSASPRWDVVVLPELNHLFQHATTGAPSEYGQIEETFAPEALQTISDWILAVVR